jgi:5-methylcytosine-specific restriction endonuclease McrA
MSREARNTTRRDRHRQTIAKDRPDCHYCHEPIDYTANHLDPLSFQVDHVVPIAKGGPDTLDNKVACHRACNRQKSDKLLMPIGVTFVTERTW